MNYEITIEETKRSFNDLTYTEAMYALSTAGCFGLITSKKRGLESVFDQVAEVRA
jgi:hypothetical protein